MDPMTTEPTDPETPDQQEEQSRDWLTLGAVGIATAAVAATFLMVVVVAPMMMIAGSVSSSGGTDTGGGEPPVVDELPGEQVALDNGCLGCHSTDGTTLAGPTWQGLAGSERELTSGEIVTADDSYLETSILDPPAQVVAGFEPLMPTTYAGTLSEQDISDLIEYIRSLS